MNLGQQGAVLPRTQGIAGHNSGFTLVETMVVMLLVGILLVAGFGALFSMDFCSRRLADYTAATAVVEAKLQDIMAATYNPPNANFGASTIYVTNSDSISLNEAGTTFKVPGTLISEIKPIASGHLITVTGIFQEPRGAITVSLQTVVNKFSAGQQ
jgi:prepilin-type N-terminal cleavage/methylation domain-containing protein